MLRLNKDALFAQLNYVPHEGQLLVHRSRAKRRVLACGARFGKSLCAAMEAIAAGLEPKCPERNKISDFCLPERRSDRLPMV